jgi:DnaJ-class molecular chaperone
MSKDKELDPIEEIEEVEQFENVEESDYEDEQDEEQDDLKVYVPISLDDSYFGTVKKISFERVSINSNLELEDGVEPVQNLQKESVDMEITIPKGAMIGEYQLFKNQGNTDSNNKTGDLVFIYIDEDEEDEDGEDEGDEDGEDEGDEDDKDEGDEDGEDEEDEGDEDECEDEDDEGEDGEDEEGDEDKDGCEEGDDGADESSYQSSESSIPKKKKYDFVRGQNNNLEITFPISLKEYYFGVERSIKYFGDKQLNIVYPFNVDTHSSYVLSGYGINGADFIVHFELELPDEIPKEYEKEFSALLDKICVNHNPVDFKQLDPAEINILDKCESESEDEEQNDEDNSNNVPSCAQQ